MVVLTSAVESVPTPQRHRPCDKVTTKFKAQPTSLQFAGFEVGKTMTRRLEIVNASAIGHRLQIVGPSPPFHLRHAKKGRIAPGMAEVTFVDFAPTEWGYQTDCVRVFFEDKESLVVPIHAYPVMACHVQRRLDFGARLIGDSVVKFLELKSDVPVAFEYRVRVLENDPQLKLMSFEGVVPENGQLRLQVTYQPTRLGTARLRLEVEVSELESEPRIVDILGNAVPPGPKPRPEEVKVNREKLPRSYLPLPVEKVAAAPAPCADVVVLQEAVPETVEEPVLEDACGLETLGVIFPWYEAPRDENIQTGDLVIPDFEDFDLEPIEPVDPLHEALAAIPVPLAIPTYFPPELPPPPPAPEKPRDELEESWDHRDLWNPHLPAPDDRSDFETKLLEAAAIKAQRPRAELASTRLAVALPIDGETVLNPTRADVPFAPLPNDHEASITWPLRLRKVHRPPTLAARVFKNRCLSLHAYRDFPDPHTVFRPKTERAPSALSCLADQYHWRGWNVDDAVPVPLAGPAPDDLLSDSESDDGVRNPIPTPDVCRATLGIAHRDDAETTDEVNVISDIPRDRNRLELYRGHAAQRQIHARQLSDKLAAVAAQCRDPVLRRQLSK